MNQGARVIRTAKPNAREPLIRKIKHLLWQYSEDMGDNFSVLFDVMRDIYIEQGGKGCVANQNLTDALANREIRNWLSEGDPGGGPMMAALDQILTEVVRGRAYIDQQGDDRWLFEIVDRKTNEVLATVRESDGDQCFEGEGIHIVHLASGEELLIDGAEPYATRVARLSEFLNRVLGAVGQ